MEEVRRGVDKEEALLQRQLRAETIRRANDKLYEQTGKMKLLRSNLLYAEVIEVKWGILQAFSAKKSWDTYKSGGASIYFAPT